VALLVVLYGIVHLVTHDPNVPGHYPPCPVFALTGLLCPGCGTLRALSALASGDIGAAWGHNPLAVLTVPWMVWGTIGLFRYAARAIPIRWYLPRWSAWAMPAGLVVYTVARNLR
jgi:hypothetical protein